MKLALQRGMFFLALSEGLFGMVEINATLLLAYRAVLNVRSLLRWPVTDLIGIVVGVDPAAETGRVHRPRANAVTSDLAVHEVRGYRLRQPVEYFQNNSI